MPRSTTRHSIPKKSWPSPLQMASLQTQRKPRLPMQSLPSLQPFHPILHQIHCHPCPSSNFNLCAVPIAPIKTLSASQMQTDNKKLAEKSTRSTELCEIAMEVKFYTDNGSKKHNRILCLLQHRNDKSQYALMFLKNRRFQSHFVDGVIPIFADFKQRLFVKGKAQDLKFDLLMMNGEIVNFEAICEWEMLNRFLDDLNSAAQSAIDHDHTLEFGTSHQWLVPYVKARDKSATELTKDLFLSSDLVESPRFSAGNSLNTTKTSFIDFSFEDDDLIGYGSPSSSTTTTTSSTTLVRNSTSNPLVPSISPTPHFPLFPSPPFHPTPLPQNQDQTLSVLLSSQQVEETSKKYGSRIA
eukprot:TRINITY_DN7012_c0_g1_i1.p1 TRINITY_DN7012_c0_g1~~TRINITY_DN7012_c0_g1_i1.p1  ORF type:complete len:354 (-),score=72.35 TRINITY_DN7012_c0_g1_i1:69-1130(-)